MPRGLSIDDNLPPSGKRGRPRLFRGAYAFFVRLPENLALEAQRRAAHQMVPIAQYLREALLQRLLREDGKK
jgi:hypothetical protein